MRIHIYIFFLISLWLLRNETQLGNLYSTAVQFSNSLYFTPVLMQFIQLRSLMYYSKCGNHMDMGSGKGAKKWYISPYTQRRYTHDRQMHQ